MRAVAMIISTTRDGLALSLRIAAITPRYYPRSVSPVPSTSSLIPVRQRSQGKERSVGCSGSIRRARMAMLMSDWEYQIWYAENQQRRRLALKARRLREQAKQSNSVSMRSDR